MQKRVTAAAVAATTSIGIALSGAALVGPAGAAERQRPVLHETDYGFQATAYGTRVTSDVAGLDSTRSAFSYLSCTRLAGRKDHETLAGVQLPANDPYVDVQTVDSRTRTYRAKKKGIDGAITGINKIGQVRLGNTSTPRLTIQDLRTQSKAWATSDGKLKTSNKVSAGPITIEGLSEDPGTGTPLDDLINAANDGIAQVIAALQENGGAIEIPGLGLLSFGFDRQVKHKYFAAASSFVLRVQLYGPDQVSGGGDDSMVGIGRSWARINRDLPAGVMGGFGFGANTKLLDGVVKVGRVGEQPLRCRGTDGKVRTGPIAGVDLGGAGQLVASGLQGRAFGVQHDSGAARAWTEGSVANAQLGPLEIRGIVGKANVKQNKAGKIVRRNIKGSSIGEILVDGDSQGSFGPGETSQIPADGIPGVAKIELFKKTRTNRGMRVSAVVITLADGSPGVSVIRLGNAQLHIRRY